MGINSIVVSSPPMDRDRLAIELRNLMDWASSVGDVVYLETLRDMCDKNNHPWPPLNHGYLGCACGKFTKSSKTGLDLLCEEKD